MKTCKVLMSVRIVTRRGHTARNPKPLRYRAEWISRGVHSVLYTSKPCDTQEQAVALALMQLRRWNSEHKRYYHYIDSTQHPERYGYSLHSYSEEIERQEQIRERRKADLADTDDKP